MLAVDDGLSTTLQPLTVSVGDVDEPPALARQSLLLSEQGVTLALQATDPEGLTAALVYEVLSVQGGHFAWQPDAASASVVTARFTQADVDARRVRFVLDAGGAPSFQLALNDGAHRVLLTAPEIVRAPATTLPAAADTPVNAAPAAAAVLPVADTAPAAATAPAAPDAPAAPANRPAPLAVDPVRLLEAAERPGPMAATPAAAPERKLAAALPAAPPPATAPESAGFWSHTMATLALPSAEALPLRDALAADFSGSRNASAWAAAMDATRAHSEQHLSVLELGGAGTVLASSGLSVGYVLWLARGGALVATLMSSVPAWASVDPLPVLSQMRRRGAGDGTGADDGGTEDDEIDPIERLFSRARRLLPGTKAAPPPVSPPVSQFASPPALQTAPAASASSRPAVPAEITA